LQEIVNGFYLLIFNAWFFFGEQASGPKGFVYWFLAGALVLSFLFVKDSLRIGLKRHITGLGTVETAHTKLRRPTWLEIEIAAVGVAFLAWLVPRRINWNRTTLGLGLSIGLGVVFLGRLLGDRRCYVLGGLTAVSAVVLAIASKTGEYDFYLIGCVVGGIYALWGAFTLILYLRAKRSLTGLAR